MDQRLSLVTLGVRDLARARRFYEEGLGWRRGNREDEVAFYQLGGIVLALYAREALAGDAGLSPEGSGFSGIALAYNTRSREEVGAVLERAVAPGAAGRGHRLGRPCRLFRRSRRAPLGGRVEPCVADFGGRRDPASLSLARRSPAARLDRVRRAL